MKIKNRYILLAVALNFTKFMFFLQKKPIILPIPTPFLTRFCLYIGLFISP